LTAFVELESTIRAAERPEDCGGVKQSSTTVEDQVKASSISSSDSFTLASARLIKPQGLDLR